MRTITAEQNAALVSRSRGFRLRVSVHDSTGFWRDLTNLNGFSVLRSLSWGESVDDPHLTASIVLSLQSYEVNVSPFVGSSPLNKSWDASAAINTLIDLRRQVKIEVQFGAADVADPGAWMTCFHGRIDSFAVDGEQLAMECRDLSGTVQDTFIERERVYGLGTPKGTFIWEDQRAYAVNDRVVPAGKLNGFYYKCTVAGTSAVTEPTWPTTIGSTVTDSGVTWQCEAATSSAGEQVESVIQKILDDNATGAGTLYTPTSPSWAVGGFFQQREGSLEAVRRLAQQLGWDVRQKWRASSAQYELTLYAPDRTKTTPDRTFAAAEYRNIVRLGVDIAGIRNVVRVIYSEAGSFASDGKTLKRKVVEVSDSASITKYGRLFMEIAEDSASQLDTAAEATKLANAALSDLATPLAENEVDAFFFPWAELGDLYRYPSNGVTHDADLDVAVVAYRHSGSITDDGTQTLSTMLQGRGKPSGGYLRWHEVAAKPGVGQSHKFQDLGGHSLTITAKAPGGAKLDSASDTALSPHWDGDEIHVSTSPGFTPGPGTLKSIARSNSVTLGELEPGKTYYAKPVPRGINGTRPIIGKPGPEVSFTVARLKDIYFDPELGQTACPPNGGFESFFNGVGTSLPDFWEMLTGTFESNRDAYPNADAHSGAYSMELRLTGVATKLGSKSLFPMEGGVPQLLTAWVKRTGTGEASQILFKVEQFNASKVSLGTTTVIAVAASAISTTAFQQLAGRFTPGATCAFAKVTFEKAVASSTYGFLVDDISFDRDEMLAKTIRSTSDELVLEETGDALGTVRVRLRNRTNYNGLVIEQGNSGIDLIDAIFKSVTAERTIRLESRSAWSFLGANEFQLGAAGDPALVVGPDGVLVRKGLTWIEVGSGGPAPAFQNSWVNFDSVNWDTAGFRKDSFGMVHIKGMVKSGTISATLPVFTLPLGYRPPKAVLFATASNNAFGRITVLANGNVLAEVGSNVWFNLSCTFRSS